ncbi:Os06g0580100 [Oryza sativa Japonica Group]|uniref:Os06g0580100 protein n=1 Tax=Oryza sativa subsp. japonica TaxID=39947 RepID=A0A0P0WY63_ORYSJ|nr:Os06g0580100 [Oryza sativa Japonica Group]
MYLRTLVLAGTFEIQLFNPEESMTMNGKNEIARSSDSSFCSSLLLLSLTCYATRPHLASARRSCSLWARRKCDGGSGAGYNSRQSHGGYSVGSENRRSRWRATRGGCGVLNARGGGRGVIGCRGQGGHDDMGEGGDVSIGLP